MASPAPLLPDDDDDVTVALLRKLRLRDKVDAREAALLRDAVAEVEDVPTGTVLVPQGKALNRCLLVVDGFLARTKDLSEGGRQITEIHVAGDFVDLHGFLLKRLDHRIETLTPARMASVPHAAIRRITENEPHLARLLWLHTLIDSSIQRERILSIGRRNALSRVAHLLCELYVRLDCIGAVEGTSFALPVTQIDLADTTGLTAVHVNRMLRQLRDRGLVTFRNGVVDIHDLPALEAAAEFDADYLLLRSEPR